MREAVIVAAARTPIGKAYRGAFNNTYGATLGAHPIRAVVDRAGIDPAEIDDVVMGCALQQGTTGQNIGRLSALTYSEKGYGYAMEKAASTKGWTFTIFEEAFNQGYPQELEHFIECVREDKPPLVTAQDGRAVLELMYAAYHSAATGQKVPLPFHAKVSRPIDLWLGKRP